MVNKFFKGCYTERIHILILITFKLIQNSLLSKILFELLLILIFFQPISKLNGQKFSRALPRGSKYYQ